MTGRRKIQRTAFPIGMINRTLHGRIDREEYPYAAADIYNMIVTRDGTVKRRNGIIHLERPGTARGRVIPFERSEDKSFILLLNHDNINILSFNSTTNTTTYVASPSAPTWMTISDVDNIDYVQSGDRMWLVHPNRIPHTLTYIADDNWELEPMDIKWDERISFLQRPFGMLNSLRVFGVHSDQPHTEEEIPGLVFRGDLTLEKLENFEEYFFTGPDIDTPGGSVKFVDPNNTRDPVNFHGSLTTRGEYSIDHDIITDPLITTTILANTTSVSAPSTTYARYRTQLVNALPGEVFRARVTVGISSDNTSKGYYGTAFTPYGSADNRAVLGVDGNDNFDRATLTATHFSFTLTVPEITIYYVHYSDRNNNYFVGTFSTFTTQIANTHADAATYGPIFNALSAGDTFDILVTTDSNVTETQFKNSLPGGTNDALSAEYTETVAIPNSRNITLPTVTAPNYYRIQFSDKVKDTGTNRVRYLDHNESLRRDISQIETLNKTLQITFYPLDTFDLTTRINENQTRLNEDAAIPDDDMDTERLLQEEKNDIEDTISRLKNEQEDIWNKHSSNIASFLENRSIYLIHPIQNIILAEYRFNFRSTASRYRIFLTNNKNFDDILSENSLTPSNPTEVADMSEQPKYQFRIIIAASGLTFEPDYPKTVSFHENRLVFGTTNNKPRTLWFSNRGIFDDFSRHLITDPVSEAETEADDSAIIIVMAGEHLNEIRWLHSDYYSLIIGTEGSIWTLRGSGDPRFTTNITHSSFILKVAFDNIGVAKVRPIQVERRIIIVEKDRRRIHEIFFSGEINTYEIQQMNYNALEIFDIPIVDIVYQRNPDFLIWCLMNDSLNSSDVRKSKFATCTYIPEEGIKAWGIQEIVNLEPQLDQDRTTLCSSITTIPDIMDNRFDNLFTQYRLLDNSFQNIGGIKGAQTETYQDNIFDSSQMRAVSKNFTSRLKTLPLVIPEWWGDRVYVEEAWVRILDSQSPYNINRTTQEIRTELELDRTTKPLYNGWYKINLLNKSTDNEREPSLTIETSSDGPLEIANLRAYLVQEDN